jgi:predicted nucleic acid-binding protein
MDWVFEGLVQLVISPAIVEEYRLVVRRPKFVRYGFPPQWLEFLIEESLHLPNAVLDWPVPVPDEADLQFLALARISGAWLVTGNIKHFPREIREGVHVLTPTDYLTYLQGS